MDPWQVDAPAGDWKQPHFFLTHGAGGDLSSPGLKAVSRALADAGHLSVRVNLPYRAGGRKSPPAAERSVSGFSEAFREATGQLGPDARWITGGRSYGGRVASMAVAAGLPAAGLVFFPYPLHRPGDPANPRTEHWPGIGVPCLFIQGTKDPFCDLDVLEEALPSLGATATLITVEGGDHSLKVSGDRGSSIPARKETSVLTEVAEQILAWVKRL